MDAALDMAAYCQRIGFDAAPRLDLATLAELHRRHPAAIAFENLSTFTGEAVSLELGDVASKLVSSRRGGYCFEHNGLFAAVLEQLGFEVERLAARVVFNRASASPPPRTHMLLRVATPAGDRLCDVGFGGLTLTAPLELALDVEQSAGGTMFRLHSAGALYELQARIGDAWKPLYRFDMQPQLPIDFEMMNHFVNTHPSSHFRTTLIAARTDDSGRYALANDRLTHYPAGGGSEQRFAKSPAELHGMLARVFGIEVDLDASLEAALGRCIT